MSFANLEYINSMRRQSEQFKSPLKSIDSLQSFKLTYQEKAPVYHNAVTIPQFLVDNLRSQHRVIKEFTGQDAILRAFYFNLMKLAFQLENQQTDYTQLVEQILVGEQQFGAGELQDKNFTDKQYRSFLKEFFHLLEEQQIPNFEETIQFYPIVDQILLKMFKQLVPFTLKLKDSSDFEVARRIFEFLSKKFKIKMQVISGCFKFLQSDIFVYISNTNQVYLIFMDQPAFIKEVTEEASSSYASQLNKSITSMSKNNQNQSKIISRTEIRNRDNPPSSDKKVFTTVINMLDSKKFPSDSSSINCRNSIEQDIEKQPYPSDNISDRITQKEKSSVQEYYDTTTINPKPLYATSVPSYRAQDVGPILHSQTFPVHKQNNSRLSSPSHQSIEERSSVRSSELSSSSHSKAKSPGPSGFQFNRDSNRIEKLTKAQTYTENSQKNHQRNTPVRKTLNSESISIESDSRVKKQAAINNLKEQSENKRRADLFKKPAVEPSVNSKVFSQATKNSNLQIFSNIKDKNGIFESNSSKMQSVGAKAFVKNELKQKQNDDSYQKFTDSGLLQILDEQYRTRIRSIKQKYREQRTRVQPGI